MSQHDASRRGSDGAGQYPFDVLQHAPIGGIGRFGRRARRQGGVFVERAARRCLADDTGGHCLQVTNFGSSHGPHECGKHAGRAPLLQRNAAQQ